MHALMLEQWGEPRDLVWRELPDPVPGPGEVLIEVRAAGCNFFDLLIVQGKYQVRPPLPFAPGGEVAGVVRAVGPGVTAVQPGDRVFALLGWGGYATHVIAPEASVVRMPAQMSFLEGAAFGIVYQTSYIGLVDRAGLRAGETLLVHAAAGGVGLAAVEIGHALGAKVLGTVGSPEKREVALRHGAEQCFVSAQPDWVDAVREATNGRGADVIYDPVGGDLFDASLRCIAWCGRLLVVGFASGTIPLLQVNRVLLKNISVIGIHWGAYRQHDPERITSAMRELFAMYERGQLRPEIFAVYPLREAAKALDHLASRRSVGKVVLAVGQVSSATD